MLTTQTQTRSKSTAIGSVIIIVVMYWVATIYLNEKQKEFLTTLQSFITPKKYGKSHFTAGSVMGAPFVIRCILTSVVIKGATMPENSTQTAG